MNIKQFLRLIEITQLINNRYYKYIYVYFKSLVSYKNNFFPLLKSAQQIFFIFIDYVTI